MGLGRRRGRRALVAGPSPGLASWAQATAADRADALQDCYLPISADGGKLLYALARSGGPDTVVEFGSSFGISTMYLAAAVTDNGHGHVLSTELSERKVAAARSNLAEAGLGAAVTILPGDARQSVPFPVEDGIEISCWTGRDG